MQVKPGWWIAGLCAAVVLLSLGYGMGRRSGEQAARRSVALAPAGAPLSTLQIEPIQPQEEMEALSAQVEVQQLAEAEASQAQTLGGVEELSTGRIKEVQLALDRAGFSPGPADGKLGPRTQAAIRDFQRAIELKPDGKIGSQTWAKLKDYTEE